MTVRRRKKRGFNFFLLKKVIKPKITKFLLRILVYKFLSSLRARLYYILLIRRMCQITRLRSVYL